MSQQSRMLQYVVAIGILVWITVMAVLHQYHPGTPNAHVFCPFGGLESLYKFLAAGGYLQKISAATMVLFGGSILMTLLAHRAFCGWICPLGTLQMLFARLAGVLKLRPRRVPAPVEYALSLIKYAILIVVLGFTWHLGTLVYAPYDPWAAYAHLSAGWEEVIHEFFIGALFLSVALVGSLWIPKNFCRYFCPMGAFLSLWAKIAPTRIVRNAATCINCAQCDRACPAQLDIATQPDVRSAQCLACGDCLAACPVPRTLTVSVGRTWTLSWMAYGFAALVLFFAPVVIAQQLGIWRATESAGTMLTDERGAKNPHNIRGSMTLQTMLREFGVPKDLFLQRFHLPADTAETAMLKTIAHAHDLEVEDFRHFVMEYLEQQPQ